MLLEFKQLLPDTWEVSRRSAEGRTVWVFDRCVYVRSTLRPNLQRIEIYDKDGRVDWFWRAPPKFRGKPERSKWQDARNALISHITGIKVAKPALRKVGS